MPPLPPWRYFSGSGVRPLGCGDLSFLSWLTIVPAVACLDDGVWRGRFPRRLPADVERKLADGEYLRPIALDDPALAPLRG